MQPADVFCALCAHFYNIVSLCMMKNSDFDIRKQALLLSSVFGSACCCEQLHSMMKKVRSRTRTCVADEHLAGCM
jgi:hypothetical protein